MEEKNLESSHSRGLFLVYFCVLIRVNFFQDKTIYLIFRIYKHYQQLAYRQYDDEHS